MAETSVKSHGCMSEYQDKQYGKGQRLMNKLLSDKGWRCTVCGELSTSTGVKKK